MSDKISNGPLMDYVLEKSLPVQESENRSFPRASMLWVMDECMRRAYYERVDPINHLEHLRMTFEHGRVCHTMIVDMLKRAGIWRGDEVEMFIPAGGANITCHIDAFIADPTNGGKVVPVEIKSAGLYSFKGVMKNGPYSSNVTQLMAYMGGHKPSPQEYGYLVYYDKNDDTKIPHFHTIKVEFNQAKFDEIVADCIYLNNQIATKSIPDPHTDPAKVGNVCKNKKGSCPYLARCFGEDFEEIDPVEELVQ